MELEKEKSCCVLQLSASDAVSALKAATLFERDVSSIDINMVFLISSSSAHTISIVNSWEFITRAVQSTIPLAKAAAPL